MNEVITSYFEESHRGLQRQRGGGGGDQPPRAFIGSSVQLPPLQGGTSLPSDAGEAHSGRRGPEPGSAPPTKLDFNKELAIASITEDRYQEVLRENERLTKKMRQLQDQLTITSAKKEAFKVQASRLEKDLKKSRDQSDALQREMLSAKQEHEYWSVQSKDAVHMMNEMRKSHIQEVRLLQRGLAQRGDDKFRNRVNEVADLVDKLGRAVVQRDEAIKEKTKLQAQLHQLKSESKTLQEERLKFRKQNKVLEERLREATKHVKTLMTPGEQEDDAGDLSDDEFEAELSAFEKRYSVLDDGAKGLDHFVEQLTKTKEKLETQAAEQADTITSLEKSLDHWQSLCAMKDQKIADLSKRLSEMQRDQLLLEQQVSSKQKEIEMQIQIERDAMSKQLEGAQGEADNARSTAEGMQMMGDKLQKELAKLHESNARLQYAKDPQSLATVDEGAASHFDMESSTLLEMGSPEPQSMAMSPGPGDSTPRSQQAAREVVFGAVNSVLASQGFTPLTRGDAEPERVLMQQATYVKTGELLQLEVVRVSNDQIELRAHDLTNGERHAVPLDQELLEELDPDDPWTELFSVVGMSRGPPRRLALPTLVGRREAPLPPAGVSLILTIYRYDPRRFYLNGFDAASQRLVDLVVMEESFSPQHTHVIDNCRSPEALFDFFVANLALHQDDEALRLIFADGPQHGQDDLA